MNSVSTPSAASAGSAASHAASVSRRSIHVAAAASGTGIKVFLALMEAAAGRATRIALSPALPYGGRRTIASQETSMPSNITVRRQRTLGGALGVTVLGAA